MHHRTIARLIAVLLVWTLSAGAASFDPGLAPFHVRFGDLDVAYRTLAVSLLPGATESISVPEPGNAGFELRASAGRVQRTGPARWTWSAPDSPGHYALRLVRDDGETIVMRAFVLRAMAEVRDGMLNDYRIGNYPANPLRGNPIYLAPDGFIEVTSDMQNLPVSPHFTLKQFFCKQQPDEWPKYLVLRETLLVKLESLLAEVNARGIQAETFHVMSGFRTPMYNEAIGNVPFSRHLWGGAADVFVDNDGDGVMDDLNNDGRLDIEDAKVLHRIAVDLSENGIWRRLLGGLGLYGPRIHRGAFVHVDARGRKARWEMP